MVTLAAGVAAADVISFRDGADGYDGTVDTSVVSDDPNGNRGTSAGLFVRSPGDGDPAERHALIRFDDLFGEDAIPEDAAITSATLTVHRQFGFSGNIDVYTLTEPFDEGSSWASFGGDGVTVGEDTGTLVAEDVTVSSASGAATIDVTSAIKAFAADPESNLGFALLIDNKLGQNLALRSSEFEDDPSLRPTLTVDYEDGGNDAAAAGLAEPGVLVTANFEDASFEPVESTSTATMSGSFPSGPLRNDAGWTTSTVTFGPAEDTGGEGGTALRVDIDEIKQGQVQLLLPGPFELDGQSELKLSFLVQGGGQTMSVRLRQVYDASRTYLPLTTLPVSTASEWRRVELTFPPVADEFGGQIEFRFDRIGDYLIDDIVLERVRRDDTARVAELRGKNLLYASSQPVGLTAPWNFAKRIGPDADEIGPTGVPALRFDAAHLEAHNDDQSLFFSVPVDVAGPITLSYWAKADGERSINTRLFPTDANPWWTDEYSTPIAVGPEWKRYSHTVDLPAPGGYHVGQLVLIGPGPDVWIDGLMAEVGVEASDFVRTDAVEVGLTNAKPLGVHFDDEAVEVSAAAWGELDALASLRVTSFDASGNARERSVDLRPDDALAAATFELDASALPLGPVRLEAVAVDAAGREISGVEELVLHRVRRPRMEGQTLADSPFGVHLWPGHPEEIDAAARLGFRWARLFHALEWAQVEPTPGGFRFEEADAMVEHLVANDFGVLAILGTTPPWARDPDGNFDVLGGYWSAKALPRDVAEYQQYVQTVAQRYAGRVHAYEPWNEPFWGRYFTRAVGPDKTTVRGTPAEYVAVHKAAAEAVRSADPDALMVWNSGGAYEREDVQAFDAEIARLGLLDPAYTDVLSVHDYSGIGSPAGVAGDLASTKHPRAARELAASAGRPDLPTWDSESGFTPAIPTGSLYRHAEPLGREAITHDQADQVVRVYVSRLAGGHEKWFLYSFASRSGYRPTYDMLAPDGHLPAFGPALSALAWHIEGRPFQAINELPGGGFAYTFADATHAVHVLLADGTGSTHLGELPAGAVARDWYGNAFAGGPLTRRAVYVTCELDQADDALAAVRAGPNAK